MARPKGHKAGCRCVACSPATRKKGQQALAAARTGGTDRGRVRKEEAETTPRRKTRRKRTRTERPAAAQQPAAPAAEPKRKPLPRAPAAPEIGRGAVQVLVLDGKRRVRKVEVFRNQTDAVAFVKQLPSGGAAVISKVLATAS